MLSNARFFLRFLPLALLLLGGAAARAEEGPPKDLVKAKLLSEASTIAPGEPFWVGVHLEMKEHWHTYWKNPGDSGLPIKLAWQLPEGFSAGEIQWPAPELHMMGPVANFGYEDEVLLPVRITPPKELTPGAKVSLAVKASWLVCADECIPGGADVQTAVTAGAAASIDEAHRAAFQAARARLPQPAPWPVALERADEGLLLRVKEPAFAKGRVATARFFPFAEDAIEHGAEQPFVTSAEGLTLSLAPSAIAEAPPERLEGVLVLEEDLDDRRTKSAFTVSAGIVKAASATAPPPPSADKPSLQSPPAAAAPAVPTGKELGLLEVLLFALLGGLILNLMPCVFPVLSLKVLGVVSQVGEDNHRIKLHGIAYTLGILVSFAVLAGALLAFRAGGAEIGWGFQLQSPVFVTVLAYVMLVMALSLSGVLEMGNSVMGVGSRLAAKSGLSGSFFTGVVATVVATPCTAPFMGAAVGFALTQPALIAIGVFLSLGFGLALPFLALSFAPKLMKKLPRPGPWMVTLKEALAFPLYGTVAWLVWVLHLQAGPEGLAAVLAGLVLVGFGAWAYGSSRMAGGKMRAFGSVVTVATAVGALLLLRMPGLEGGGARAVATAAAGPAAATEGAASGKNYEPYRPERLDALLGEGKPVFVNMTAAWCVTCLVNERTALSTDGVKQAFAERGITYLKGDWTNEDPEITRLLERFGRSGVPLYLYYAAGKKEPVVLPQVLTESIVLEHLEKT